MTETLDVAARLAEGAPAVEVLARYVAACRQLGYQHPELTLHEGQVRDWYGSEDGMDLQALQHDCTALQASVRAVQEALAVQQRQLEVVSAAWQGAGARASVDVLRRHTDAAAATTAALRTACDALSDLREWLWRSVDAKVDAAVAIEGRAAAVRGHWLAAAATVTTGVGDRAAASELVDHAVKPFVERSVAADWLTAMRTATSSIADAYERATAEIAGERLPAFEAAGALDPVWSAPAGVECDDRVWRQDAGAGPAAAPVSAVAAPLSAVAAPAADRAVWVAAPAAASGPAAWTAPSSAAPAGPTLLPEPSVLPPPEPSVLPPAGPVAAAPPALGGLAGLGQQFSEAVSGLLGGVGDAVGGGFAEFDAPDLGDPFAVDEGEDAEAEREADEEADPEGDEDSEDADEAPEDGDGEPEDGDEEPEEGDGEPEDGDTGDVAATEPQPGMAPAVAVEPPAAPPPAEPLPPVEPSPAGPAADGRTPCEIAADELPQVGEAPVSSPGPPAGR